MISYLFEISESKKINFLLSRFTNPVLFPECFVPLVYFLHLLLRLYPNLTFCIVQLWHTESSPCGVSLKYVSNRKCTHSHIAYVLHIPISHYMSQG